MARIRMEWKLAIFVAMLAAAVVSVSIFSEAIVGTLDEALDTIKSYSGWKGAGMFILLYTVSTVFLLPSVALSLDAGLVFTTMNDGNQYIGVGVATVVVTCGASLGAVIAFLLSRHCFQFSLTTLGAKYPFLRALDNASRKQNRRIVLLLRLSPFVPFNILNYLLGATSMPLSEYVITLCGMIPGSITFCFIGSTMTGSFGAGAEVNDSGILVREIFAVVGSVISVFSVWYIFRYVKKELLSIGIEPPQLLSGKSLRRSFSNMKRVSLSSS